MTPTQLINKLGRNDTKLIGRDSLLVFMFLFGIIVAIAHRFILPWLNVYLAETKVMPGETLTMHFSDTYPLVVAYMAIFTGASLVGSIFGFMLLDEKDDNTIVAMMVTPVPLSRYLVYRTGGTAALAFFMILVMVLCINQALVPIWQLLLIAAGGSLMAPIAALFYATVAENKVQGFAYAKFAGVAGWIILIGWFVEEPFQWLFGLFPPFLVSKAYWMALEDNRLWWIALIAGMVLQAVLIGILIRHFNRAGYR